MRNPDTEKLLVTEEISIRDALALMSEVGKKSLVVVDPGKRLLGTLSDGDVRRAIDKSNYFFDMTAQDIMSRGFISVAPNELASECLNIMAKKNIGCLAVMKDDSLVGVINQKDLVKLGI